MVIKCYLKNVPGVRITGQAYIGPTLDDLRKYIHKTQMKKKGDNSVPALKPEVPLAYFLNIHDKLKTSIYEN
jgi:hypothetical protein